MLRAFNSLVFVIFLLASGGQAASPKPILILGDSLSTAYGMPQARGWVTLLGARLKREPPDYIVVNASISGETTAGGASRIADALSKHRPAIVIVQLGGNDGLRGLPVSEMKRNLGVIIERTQKAGARVLLIGVTMPPNYGPDYTAAFQTAFEELAKRHRVPLVRSLMEGFGQDYELFQPDRIHPNEAAQPLIQERVWKALRPLLR